MTKDNESNSDETLETEAPTCQHYWHAERVFGCKQEVQATNSGLVKMRENEVTA